MALLDRWYALDLGAYQMHFYDFSSQKQVHLQTIMAFKNNQLIACSTDALPYLYKELDTVQIKYPISHGQMLTPVEAMIRYGLNQLDAYSRLLQPCVIACVPTDLTQAQREAWQREFLKCDISKVQFVSNMEILREDKACFIIHAGHSYTELGIYAHDKTIVEKTLFYAGAQMDEQIQKIVFMKTGCFISKVDASSLKEQASLSLKNRRNDMLACFGFDKNQNLCKIQIEATSLWPALEMVARQIALWAKHCFDTLPTKIQESILVHGIEIGGGLASCYGLAEILSQQLSCPILCTKRPHCDMIDALKEYKSR